MTVVELHRRFAILMGLCGLVAFAAGAGVQPISALVAGAVLLGTLFWRPSRQWGERLEKLFLPLALLLTARALWHVVGIGGDVVLPVVDLLLLLLCAEALRSPDSPNDIRLYALSFALLLAASAYRPGVVFAIAFLGYIVLATVTLMLGNLKRQALTHGEPAPRVSARFVALTSAFSLVILASATVVFLAFPRISQGWAGRGETQTTSVAGFSDRVGLGEHGSAIYGNPQVVLRVEFPDGPPEGVENLYWRGRSYDRFDGVAWSRTDRLPPSNPPNDWYLAWDGERIRQDIYAAAIDARVIFALHPLLSIQPESEIHPIRDYAGDVVYWGSSQPIYQAISVAGRPPPEVLREAEGRFVPARQNYLQLPLDLPDRIRTLADSLTAGRETVYDRARAIEAWFHSEFAYTRELPATAAETGLDHFLFERRAGHCEYFSTGMAILLRAAGIATREVNGFLGGQWSETGQYLAVTQNEAHAWVEVWFPGVGWVPFDPTPAGSTAASIDQSWFWPGRFLFDGLQHRWNKWVLDYTIDDQGSLFGGLSDLLGSRTQSAVEDGQGDVAENTDPRQVAWGVLAGLLVLVLVWYLHRRANVPAPTRFYLKLRRAAEKAGVGEVESLGPVGLLRRWTEERMPGRGHAEVVVDGYARFRFGGGRIDDDGLSRMREALREATRELRSHRTGP